MCLGSQDWYLMIYQALMTQDCVEQVFLARIIWQFMGHILIWLIITTITY